jgi:hypothetical protein
MDDERKFSKDQITTNVSTWVPITGNFKAEHYPGTPLLDTSVELIIPPLCITWKNRQKLMDDLAELLRKYQI